MLDAAARRRQLETDRDMNDTQPPFRGRLAMLDPAFGYSEFRFVVLEATADAYFDRARSISDAVTGSATLAELVAKLDSQDRQTLEEHLVEAGVSDLDADLDDEAVWTILYEGDGEGDGIIASGALGSLLPYEPGLCLKDLLSLDETLLQDDEFREAVSINPDEGAYVIDAYLLAKAMARFGYRLQSPWLGTVPTTATPVTESARGALPASSDRASAEATGTSDKARTYVLADEFGMMCIIPIEDFGDAWLDAEAGYRISALGEVGYGDVDRLADGIDKLRDHLRGHIDTLFYGTELRPDGDWDLHALWNYLVENELVDEDDEDPPANWRPSEAQLAQVRVAVGDSFFESSGLRDERWAGELPPSVVEKFGGGRGGMFGDYSGFDWKDEAAITDALTSLGHQVVYDTPVQPAAGKAAGEADVIPWA